MSGGTPLRLPSPPIRPLRGGPVLRWGIAGPGRIAEAFVRALGTRTDQVVAAVGSRSSARAEEFARRNAIERAWGSYEQLVHDPGVDIVYVSLPNVAHRPVAELALAAGKHVLVEKPMGIDVADAATVFDAARAAGRFAMEGMWSRFLPQTDVLRAVLTEGILGQIREVGADFGERFDPAEERSVFDPAMGGGALRDIGVYPVWFAHLVLDSPELIAASGTLTDSGVDGESTLRLRDRSGARADLHTTLHRETPTVARVIGTAGRVDIAAPFLMPGGLTVTTGSGDAVWRDRTGLAGLDGLAWEAVAVAEEIAAGHVEPQAHPAARTLAVLGTLDHARSLLGAP